MRVRVRWRRVGLVCVVVGACVAAPLLLLPRRPSEDPSAPCGNCSIQLRMMLETWAEEHDGWYPGEHAFGREDWTPWRSSEPVLAADSMRCLSESLPIAEGDAHLFTSHALEAQAEAHVREHGVLSDRVSCWRYNPGLRLFDRGLILLHSATPTDRPWRFGPHAPQPGRTVLLTGGEWAFLAEAEFQREQARTLGFVWGRYRSR